MHHLATILITLLLAAPWTGLLKKARHRKILAEYNGVFLSSFQFPAPLQVPKLPVESLE
jgi:hypothetical protein